MKVQLAVLAAAVALVPVMTDRAEAAERRYYIAADEVVWDYAPLHRNMITGAPLPPARPDSPSSKYVKALYRDYTDATFRTLKPRARDQAYLGYLGPVIRAEVGDTIRVVFRNNAHHPFSMHPHGVRYAKDSEGAPYLDGTSPRPAGAVPPGGTRHYRWDVPERAGPGPADVSSVLWMYHSHVDETRDVSSGLMGPIVITGRGKARPDASPADVDREFVMLFAFGSEIGSWYIDESVRRFAARPQPGKHAPGFFDANLRMAMNGYTFGNMPLPTMRAGERVRWYTMANAGDDSDIHTPHWHGQTVLAMGMRTDVVTLLPASMVTVDMIPDNPGIWLVHCHVPGHLDGGMVNRFRVLPGRPKEP
jgi:FtsP/CotA-like multicopper oxidase with cupredoxin domain